jgi:hypothetical protein
MIVEYLTKNKCGKAFCCPFAIGPSGATDITSARARAITDAARMAGQLSYVSLLLVQ